MASAIFRLRDRLANNMKPGADALADRKAKEDRSDGTTEHPTGVRGGIFSGLVNSHHPE
jgi:hypothetical protein